MKPATPKTERPPATRLRKVVFGGSLNTIGNSTAHFHQVHPHLSKLVLAASLLAALFSPTTRMPAASSDGCGPSFIRLELHDQLEKQSLANALEATLVQSVVDVNWLANYSILDMSGTSDWALVNVVFGPARETDAVWTFPAEKLHDGWRVHCPGSPDAMRVIARIPTAYNPLAGLDANDWQLTTPIFLGGQPQTEAAQKERKSTVQYRLPYANGTTVYITQDSATHGGPIDMVGQSGKTIVAAADGWIRNLVQSHNECCCNSVCNPCNNYIWMEHANNEWTRYYHIAQNSAQVSIGQYVTAGTPLATEGDVGNTCSSSTGSRPPVACNGSTGGTQNCAKHLHFGLLIGGSAGTYENPNFCNVGYVTTGQTKTASDCTRRPDLTGPTVTALSTGNNLTLLWPDSTTGYRVESALSLSPPTSWSNVTGTFQTNGGFISIILPTPGPQKFYRLVNP